MSNDLQHKAACTDLRQHHFVVQSTSHGAKLQKVAMHSTETLA